MGKFRIEIEPSASIEIAKHKKAGNQSTIKKLAAKGIIVNDVTDAVEKAIARFKIKYKAYPQNLAELEQTKLIGLSPEIKNLFDIEIRKDGSFRLIEKE